MSKKQKNQVRAGDYPSTTKRPKRLFMLAIKHWWAAVCGMWVVLPFLALLCWAKDSVWTIVAGTNAHTLSLIVLAVLIVLIWSVALCLADVRLRRDQATIAQALRHSWRRFPWVAVLGLGYIVLTALYFLLIMGLQWLGVNLHFSQWLMIAKGIFILVLGLAYIYVAVTAFMAFLFMLLERRPLWLAIKHSVELTIPHWIRAFVTYAGFFIINGLIFFPAHMRLLPLPAPDKLWIVQVLAIVCLSPFWCAWYLLTFNDMKLREQKAQAKDKTKK